MTEKREWFIGKMQGRWQVLEGGRIAEYWKDRYDTQHNTLHRMEDRLQQATEALREIADPLYQIVEGPDGERIIDTDRPKRRAVEALAALASENDERA